MSSSVRARMPDEIGYQVICLAGLFSAAHRNICLKRVLGADPRLIILSSGRAPVCCARLQDPPTWWVTSSLT